jgi:hypothetical protein
MSEYLHVEKPFLDQLGALSWKVIDQGQGFIPSNPSKSLRTGFREWILPEVFRDAIRSINLTPGGKPWLTDRQLDDLRDQILRQPHLTLLEANEAVQSLFFKAQVDVNEVTGESDPVVQLIDFARPDRNQFHAINQFRVDTPGCIKNFIIPDIVLFINGMPLVVVEAKIGDPNTANPMTPPMCSFCATAMAVPRPSRPDSVRASRAFFIQTFCLSAPAARRPSLAPSPPGTSISLPGKTSGPRATRTTRRPLASNASRRTSSRAF